MSHESRVFLSGIGVEGWTADSSYTYGKRKGLNTSHPFALETPISTEG